MRWELHAATLVALVLACRPSDAFTCADDDECSGGVCQPTGFCSFPSDSCPSGQQYGEHAADGLAGQCVEPGESEGTTSTGSGPASTSTADPPSLDSSSDGEGTTAPSTSTSSESSGSSSTGEPLDPDLLLWFRFEDLPGDVTLDAASGYAATCAEGQCPTPIDGPFGTAALFDGDDDGFTLPYDPVFELPGELSATAWVRADMLDGAARRMVFGHPNGGGIDNAWLLYFYPYSGNWEVGWSMNSNGGNFISFDPPFALGQWAHLAGTYDGMTMRFYVDGVFMGESATTPPTYDPEHPITLGYDINGNMPVGRFFGAIDELRLYTRALTPEEIVALASR